MQSTLDTPVRALVNKVPEITLTFWLIPSGSSRYSPPPSGKPAPTTSTSISASG